MAFLSSHTLILTTTRSSSSHSLPKLFHSHHHSSSPNTLSFPIKPTTTQNTHNLSTASVPFDKWSTKVSFFPTFLNKPKDAKPIKEELLEAIAPLDRGADATPEDQQRIDQIARKLEAVNPTKEPLKSDLLNGKWELIYTTSASILQTQRPKLLRSRTNYQAINADTLRAQNMESWPFFNQACPPLVGVASANTKGQRWVGGVKEKMRETRVATPAPFRLFFPMKPINQIQSGTRVVRIWTS